MDQYSKKEKQQILKATQDGVAAVKALTEESTEPVLGIPAQYWLSLRDLDGENILKNRLDIPVLVLQGTADFQVYMDKDFEGLCFVNLVDFDMHYGHRNDVDGYARALAEFDASLPQIMAKLREDDVLMITADHGCDPGFIQSTDHSREFVPFLMYGNGVTSENLGTIDGFNYIADTVKMLLRGSL
jgi:hypothetical protein